MCGCHPVTALTSVDGGTFGSAQQRDLAEEWPRRLPLRMRVILVALVQRVEISPDEVIINLRPLRLAALLDDRTRRSQHGSGD